MAEYQTQTHSTAPSTWHPGRASEAGAQPGGLFVVRAECEGRRVQVEVFRRLYEAVGLGWVYSVTKVAAIGRAADAVYDVWAKYRLPITGRPGLLEVMRTRDEAGCRPAREEATAAAAAADAARPEAAAVSGDAAAEKK